MTERDFAAVATQVAPRLYRIGLRMCGNPADAEDLVQETLLRAFRKWDQFEGRSDPGTWLYTIAARVCQRHRRRRAGEPRRLEPLAELLPSPDDRVPAIDRSASPFDEHVKREAEAAVAAGLASLPPAIRLTLVLADVAELSTREIAGVLGLKEATVKTRVHRGRLALRRALLQKLPTRPAAAPDHERRVCLDLLQAKQEALDRHAPFSIAPAALCERCRSLFATLDLGREMCAQIGRSDELPPGIRQLIEAHRTGSPHELPAARRPS